MAEIPGLSDPVARRPSLPPGRRAARAGDRQLIEQARVPGQRADQAARDPDRLVAALGPRRDPAQLAAADPLRPALTDDARLRPLGGQLAAVAALAQPVARTAVHAAA